MSEGTVVKRAMDIAMDQSVKGLIDKDRLFNFAINIEPSENRGVIVRFPNGINFVYSESEVINIGRDLGDFFARLGKERKIA